VKTNAVISLGKNDWPWIFMWSKLVINKKVKNKTNLNKKIRRKSQNMATVLEILVKNRNCG